MEEDLNLLSEELLEQIELFPFQGYSTTYQELEYNYNYHIRYRTQRLKIQNQIEQESQQLIKNLILSNQITPNQNPILNKYRELPKHKKEVPYYNTKS